MKVLVDLPDELYDTLRSKTLNLLSGARSNGKHLVCELIGRVMAGTVVEDENKTYKELQSLICNKSVSISDLTILKGVYFALQVIEDYIGGSRAWIANVPFVTGLSADSADVPECETWSNNNDGFLSTGYEAFIDTDWLTDNRIATVQERNCEVCKHHVLDERTQRYACEKWKCEFERQ